MHKRSFLKFGIAAGTAGFSLGSAAKNNFKFKYAHNAPTDHPLHIHASRACEKIAQRTKDFSERTRAVLQTATASSPWRPHSSSASSCSSSLSWPKITPIAGESADLLLQIGKS